MISKAIIESGIICNLTRPEGKQKFAGISSSNERDFMPDPFSGYGTTIAAAQKLGRRWIGIGITHLSGGLQKLRLKDTFGIEPTTKKLTTEHTESTKKTTEKLSVSSVNSVVNSSYRVIVSIKSGHVTVARIRNLLDTIERKKTTIGVYLTPQPATEPMILG